MSLVVIVTDSIRDRCKYGEDKDSSNVMHTCICNRLAMGGTDAEKEGVCNGSSVEISLTNDTENVEATFECVLSSFCLFGTRCIQPQ